MILRNQLIQRHRKQRHLTPTFSLNESHQKCPRSREGIFSFIYRPAQCFVTVCLSWPFWSVSIHYSRLCSKSTAQERRRSETSHLAESHRVRTCSADDTVCVRRSDDFRPAFHFSFHCQLRKHSDRHD